MTHLPTVALFSFINEETNELIAITGETKILEHIAGGEESTISVDGIILLYGDEYVVSDIQINTLTSSTHFDPKEYDGLGLGGAVDYTVAISLIVYPRH